ncbi:MAG: preprotein translocase subunit SecA [Chitinophagales bacterium]|nr:preprotein translocase subunit SecA [Chitinophagales bacterium]
MFDFITKAVSKLFGSKSDKDIKEIMPYVERSLEEFEKLKGISHDELRNKTTIFRQRIQDYLADIDTQITEITVRVEEDVEMDAESKEREYNQLDKLRKDRDQKLEEVLLEILPEAFAVVKETASRFRGNNVIRCAATELDRELAVTRPHIRIVGNTVEYDNSWMAAGNMVTWDMVHYDVQLIGGVALHQGKIAEMATGEGKTLVATLPAYLNGLSGQGVHLVTVNDYLARRDSEWMAPIFQFLGLTVDCIDKYQPNSEERKQAYLADITYGTNNEFGFDYLRDNMARNPSELVQRKHHFAMVDEVDSVLIDDARTPLIISGPVPKGEEQEFEALKPRIVKLYEAQKRAVNGFLTEAKRQIESGKAGEKDGGLALLRAHRGLPKAGPLIKFLSETGMRQVLQKTENHYLADQQKEMPTVDAELFFVIDEKHNSVELTEKGIDLITGAGEDHDFFIVPDVGAGIAEIERNTVSEEEKRNLKDQLLQDFAIKSERIHSVTQLLKAYTLFEKDVEYVVMDGKVKIVDENTGRIMEGRRYSDGLHQAIEAKENVKVEAATQTFATITLQNYFRMYHKLAGMTGTAETEAGEFWEIYKLDVVVIPTNKPIVRKDMEDLVYKTKREKYNAVIDHIVELTQAGRPVLVGTTSVEVSELISRLLKLKNIKHNVLNAKQHQREAEIVAEAGKAGTVTIATNMAGRGTDIKLGPGVREAGGLAIVGTERHESRRVDRQLRGRAGRQGDTGSSQFFVSLEDNLMRMFGSDRIASLMDRMGYKEGEVIQHSMVSKSIERAQKKVEENNFGIRKRLLEYDDVMNSQREVIYTRRRHALFGERLSVDINNMVYSLCEEVIASNQEIRDFEGFKLDVIRNFSADTQISEQEFLSQPASTLVDTLFDEVQDAYHRKVENIVKASYPVMENLYQTRGANILNVMVPFSDGKKTLNVVSNLQKVMDTRGRELVLSFEKNVTLGIIDESWKEHLREMDELKQSVQNAVFEQKDPLLIYKLEAYNLFKVMVTGMNKEVVSFLFKGNVPFNNQQGEVREAREPQRTDMSRMKAAREDDNPLLNGGGALPSQGNGEYDEPEQRKLEPIRVEKKVGRNEPCPCGSGKKFKNCHGKDE